MTIYKPQAGPQTAFMASSADITIYGGHAGSGKSYALLLEPTRWIRTPGMTVVIFRRTHPQIRQEGGLWEIGHLIYRELGARISNSFLRCVWPGGCAIKMSHLEYENTVYDWDGSQIGLIEFDELRSFTEKQFFYMLSRNRSVAGVRPYVRATTNPAPDSWLRKFLDWWIGEDGYAIGERSGKVRWFVRVGNEIYWNDRPDALKVELLKEGLKPDEVIPKSVTFINATLEDNRILMHKDPYYKGSLLALHKVERERLTGNWNAVGNEGDYFDVSMFRFIDEHELPARRTTVRFWDRAGTEQTDDNDPDATCGVKMSRDSDGQLYLEHATELIFKKPGAVLRVILDTAHVDGRNVTVGAFKDPGQAGVDQIERFTAALSQYRVASLTESEFGGLLIRVGPLSAHAAMKPIKVVKGSWVEGYLKHLYKFPKGRYKDPVAALIGCYYYLTSDRVATLIPEYSSPGELTDDRITLENDISLW